jgi:phage terminase large subunit-like protein
MKVNYDDIVLTPHQKAIYLRTIEKNPFIPSNNLLKTKLYDKQIYTICSQSKRKLLGGSAFSGKSRYGASSALQWFEVPDYRCLVIRRIYDDVIATGGIVDYLDRWLYDFDYIEHNQSKKVFHNTLNDAKIFYNYMRYEDDKLKFKSRAYNKIIIDEASELLKVNLRYVNRSLRPTEADERVPLSLEYISNPESSSGVEYLKKKFVSDKGPYPYFEMNFWNNPFVNPVEYKETLGELSKADYEFQMGNWDYTLSSGDIFDYDLIKSATINQEEYKKIVNEIPLMRLIRGWDIASTDKKTSDYTASSLIEVYHGDVDIVRKQESFKKLPGHLEKRMKTTMDLDGPEVEHWIEQQPATGNLLSDNYWKNEFEDYNVKFIPVFRNKVIRAGRMVPLMKQRKLLFLEDENKPYLTTFRKQAINFPNFDIKNSDDEESMHDDRIDTISIVMNKLHPYKSKKSYATSRIKYQYSKE